MNKLFIIIQREYLSRVKKRSFILTTLLVPLLIIGIYGLMAWLMLSDTGEAKQIAVVDESGYFNNKLSNSSNLFFSYPDTDFDELREDLPNTNFDGILYIPKLDVFKVNDNIRYYSTDRIGTGPKDYMVSELKRQIRNLRMKELSIDDNLLDSLDVSMTLPEMGISEEEETKQTASEVLSLIGYLIGLMLYFVLLFFGTMVMRGVKEEKTNRIVEVIMSSVKPIQLMLGKIVGISFVGLTQFLIWGVIFYIGYGVLLPIFFSGFDISPETMQAAEAAGELQDLDGFQQLLFELVNYNYTPLIIAFLFYFLGGYFIYASLFSAVGSIVEDDNESQQFVFPVMLPIILSIGILTSVMNDPHNPVAVWSSIFPLTSPIIMPARIPFNPPTWQIVASVVSMFLGSLFFAWLSAKIYRVGILMYGKKVNFKELMKWIRY